MRITHIDSRAVLNYSLVLAGCIFVLDMVVVMLLWAILSAMGIFAALGVGLGLTTVVGVGLLLAVAHAAVTAVLVWLAGVAFNLSAAWTHGISVRTNADEPLVLPDTAFAQFGQAPEAGVASPSVSTARAAVKEVTVRHDG